MNDIEKFKTWQNIKELSKDFPEENLHSLTSQIRRAVISGPLNIAEGAWRNTNKDFVKFISITLGSLNEVLTLIIFPEDLHYISRKNVEILRK